MNHDRMPEKLYFMGIGGTGMAAVAGLFQELGYKITGSDAGVYPPMSLMLQELGIKVHTPYSEKNLGSESPDLVVVANVLSRGNTELEYALAKGIPYTSFPALLGDKVLKHRKSIVVAGTHGKTTTTSLLAHVLTFLGEDPGFLIGGLPRNFSRSFKSGTGELFAIEGDEYDTAFFDKGPKFLHYYPYYSILNNLEYDHADIYPNLEAIEAQFDQLARLVKDPANILANIDDPGISRLLDRTKLKNLVTSVSTLGLNPNAKVCLLQIKPGVGGRGEPQWQAWFKTKYFGEFSIKTQLAGKHNMANIAQVIACVERLSENGHLRSTPLAHKLSEAIASFAGVARRLDLIAHTKGIDIYEDFAHHPTAVQTVIEGFRAMYPQRRLVVAFEPRSATQRRNVFQNAFASALSLADKVYIGECPLDQRISDENRMNTKRLQESIGMKAQAFSSNQALLEALGKDLMPGDSVIFMSSGNFSGTQHKLAEVLESR